MSYQDKYLKYKSKYLKLKNNSIQIGGAAGGGGNIDNDLIEACKNQDLAEVNRLIALGANIETNDRMGPPLYHAIRRRNLAIVNRLIGAGANVNQYTGSMSLLYTAAQEGNLEILNVLLNAGANPNIPGDYNLVPLITTAANSHLDVEPEQNLAIFNRLVAAGADINASDTAGDTVLIYAASSGNLPVVIRLIELGARIDDRNRYGSSAIMHTRSLEILNRLIAAGANLTFLNNYGRNVLDLSYENEELDLVRRLLEAGVRPGPSLEDYQYADAPGYERASAHREAAGVAGGGGGGGQAPEGGVYNRAALIEALSRKGDTPVPEISKHEKDMTPEEKAINEYLNATKCGLCLTNMKYVTICMLGHQICGTCTKDIISRNVNKCPNCRNHIDEKNFKIVNKKYLKY